MYFKLEPSGCCEHRGMVQIRFDFFLEPGDARYDEWRQTMMAANDGGPLAAPFHVHFMYFNDTTSPEKKHNAGKEFLLQAYNFWKEKKQPKLKNPAVKFPHKPTPQMTPKDLADDTISAKKKACRDSLTSLLKGAKIWR